MTGRYGRVGEQGTRRNWELLGGIGRDWETLGGHWGNWEGCGAWRNPSSCATGGNWEGLGAHVGVTGVYWSVLGGTGDAVPAAAWGWRRRRRPRSTSTTAPSAPSCGGPPSVSAMGRYRGYRARRAIWGRSSSGGGPTGL